VGSESFWDAVTDFNAFIPTFNDAGGSGYYYVIPSIFVPAYNANLSTIVLYGFFANQTSTQHVDTVMAPLLTKLRNIFGANATMYNATAWPSAADIYTSDGPTASDTTGSGVILGSRLISHSFLASKSGPAKLTAAMRSFRVTPGFAFNGNVVAGGQVAANAGRGDSALHSAWRTAVVELIFSRDWTAETSVAEQLAIRHNVSTVEVGILKALEPGPGGGTYLNEANCDEVDFQDSFWGKNYPRLYAFKQRWDPTGLFIVRKGVGSEDWDDEGFCRLH
jgi:Berberine and berberine like